MKLHPIQHDLPGTLWCGPAALSACCGVPTSQIHRAIKIVRGDSRRPVKGVNNGTLVKAAERFGYRLLPIWDQWIADPQGGMRERKQPTLAAFTKDFSAYMKDAPVIINVTGHYVVVHGRTFVDNQVKIPMSLKKAPGRRRRVKRAWQVVPMGEFPVPQTVLT